MIDVRSPASTLVSSSHARLPAGRCPARRALPGAANVPWARAAREDGTFKSADELKEIYEGEAGLSGDREVIAYSASGALEHTWFVLSYLLGYDNVRTTTASGRSGATPWRPNRALGTASVDRKERVASLPTLREPRHKGFSKWLTSRFRAVAPMRRIGRRLPQGRRQRRHRRPHLDRPGDTISMGATSVIVSACATTTSRCKRSSTWTMKGSWTPLDGTDRLPHPQRKLGPLDAQERGEKYQRDRRESPGRAPRRPITGADPPYTRRGGFGPLVFSRRREDEPNSPVAPTARRVSRRPTARTPRWRGPRRRGCGRR